MKLSERVRAEVSLRALAEARGVIFDARKSQPRRGDWWAPCPFHAERTPSFHVVEPQGTDGWFRCFGCEARGSAIDFLMQMDGLSALEAMKRLAEDHGLAPDPDPAEEARRAAERTERLAKAEARAAASAESRWQGAKIVWRQATAPLGLLRAYLTARGVDLPALGHIPPTLRLAEALNCWAEGQDRKREHPVHAGPAMVGAIGRGRLVGVHRTWITAEGRALLPDGAKAPKKWLGRTGAMMGEPVRLSPGAATVVAGEGIETTLAAFAALRAARAREIAAEAALSLGALMGAWVPPAGARRVILLAEGSSKPAVAPAPGQPAGKPSGAETAERLTRAGAARLEGLGLEVRVALPGGAWDRDCDAADIAREFARG